MLSFLNLPFTGLIAETSSGIIGLFALTDIFEMIRLEPIGLPLKNIESRETKIVEKSPIKVLLEIETGNSRIAENEGIEAKKRTPIKKPYSKPFEK
jgi:hypothetical protein